MKKRYLFLLILIPIFIFVLCFFINLSKRTVYRYDGYITYEGQKYIDERYYEQRKYYNIFRPTDYDDYLGTDIFFNDYTKSVNDIDCNIIHDGTEDFHSFPYFKEGYTLPELKDLYISEIIVEDRDSDYSEKHSFNRNISIYDICTISDVTEKELEYERISIDIYFSNLPYLYIFMSLIYKNDKNKLFIEVVFLDHILEVKEEYKYLFTL